MVWFKSENLTHTQTIYIWTLIDVIYSFSRICWISLTSALYWSIQFQPNSNQITEVRCYFIHFHDPKRFPTSSLSCQFNLSPGHEHSDPPELFHNEAFGTQWLFCQEILYETSWESCGYFIIRWAASSKPADLQHWGDPAVIAFFVCCYFIRGGLKVMGTVFDHLLIPGSAHTHAHQSFIF